MSIFPLYFFHGSTTIAAMRVVNEILFLVSDRSEEQNNSQSYRMALLIVMWCWDNGVFEMIEAVGIILLLISIGLTAYQIWKD